MHLAVYFPGGSIPGQDPLDERLAWVTLRALEQAGAFVVPVRYDDNVQDQDPERDERTAAGQRVLHARDDAGEQQQEQHHHDVASWDIAHQRSSSRSSSR